MGRIKVPFVKCLQPEMDGYAFDILIDDCVSFQLEWNVRRKFSEIKIYVFFNKPLFKQFAVGIYAVKVYNKSFR